jgi:hypothetical protein
MYAYLGSAAKSLAALLSGDVRRSAGQQVMFVVGLVATAVVTTMVTRRARRLLTDVVRSP